MVFGFPPFNSRMYADPEEGNKKIYSKIRKGFCPQVKAGYGAWFPKDIQVTHEFKDLLARLLRKNIAKRMTAEEALAHPWISRNSHLKNDPLPTIRALRIFRRSCALKTDILRILRDCNFLNRNQEESVRETFRLIDTDGDGIITADELQNVIKQIDPEISRDEIREIILAVDLNGKKGITVDEFLSARINRKVVQKEERLRKLFKCLDLDGNGTLRLYEISAALESVSGNKLTGEEVKDLFSEVKTSKKGEIDYEEFLVMFGKKTHSQE